MDGTSKIIVIEEVQLIVWYYTSHFFLVITVFNELENLKSFGSKCDSKT